MDARMLLSIPYECVIENFGCPKMECKELKVSCFKLMLNGCHTSPDCLMGSAKFHFGGYKPGRSGHWAAAAAEQDREREAKSKLEKARTCHNALNGKSHGSGVIKVARNLEWASFLSSLYAVRSGAE
ncbi:hypothetical protein Cni_G03931 [Canna indica]|uniref:Uncharacterized protein n=1 Tax=Canna indica TaxID=4628 RepID=A0AAQ3JS45_9LILI|nr:hypothetical protein Cni_G03931 [Canna indica]